MVDMQNQGPAGSDLHDSTAVREHVIKDLQQQHLLPITPKRQEGRLEKDSRKLLQHAMSVGTVLPPESFRMAADKRAALNNKGRLKTIEDEELHLEPAVQFKHKALIDHGTRKVEAVMT